MLDASRKLRKESTVAEQKLWFYLRNKRFCNIKFKRQYVIENYIVDFICLKNKLIIEVDGSQHLESMEYDANRTYYLESKGFRMIRFWNHEVLNMLNHVLEKIHMALSFPPNHSQ